MGPKFVLGDEVTIAGSGAHGRICGIEGDTYTVQFSNWQGMFTLPQLSATPEVEIEQDEDADSTFPYNALARMGVTNVVIEYSGQNDEGWINEVIPEGLPDGVELSGDLEETLKDAAYGLLEHYHGGWEINEGATGQILVDVQAKKGTIHHGACREVYDYTDTEVS